MPTCLTPHRLQTEAAAWVDRYRVRYSAPHAHLHTAHLAMGWLNNWLHAGGTGGLNWHVHAWQSRVHWQPTLDAIDAFLHTIRPHSTHLLLLGGSAGWMMPTAWLQTFARIDAYDIDPFAPWLFQWRHGRHLHSAGIAVHHHRLDVMTHLDTVLAHHPQACVWFDNMLGQHRYRVRDEVRTEQELQALASRLHHRSWGSLHDVYSGASPVALTAAQCAQGLVRDRPAGQVDAAFMQTRLQQCHAQGVWHDHGTLGVFPPAVPTWLIPWQFRPGYWHWLQAGWVAPDAKAAPTG